MSMSLILDMKPADVLGSLSVLDEGSGKQFSKILPKNCMNLFRWSLRLTGSTQIIKMAKKGLKYSVVQMLRMRVR